MSSISCFALSEYGMDVDSIRISIDWMINI